MKIVAQVASLCIALAPAADCQGSEEWTFHLAPYFWAAGLDGETASFGLPTVDVNASFSDIFDHLKFGAMAIAEARRGPYSLFTDLMYSNVSGAKATPRGVVASSVELRSKSFSGLAGAGYSFLYGSSANFDLAAGLRVWSIDNKLSFTGGALDGRSANDGATWVDGVLGLRTNYHFSGKMFFTGWGLAGAGGADLDWDAAGGIGYNFSEGFGTVLGYRALGVDYSDDEGFVFDVVQHGPILGLVWRF